MKISMSTKMVALNSLRANLARLDDAKQKWGFTQKILMRASDKADPHSKFAFDELNKTRTMLRRIETRRNKIIGAITQLKRVD